MSERVPSPRGAGLVDRDDRLTTGRTGVRWRPAWRWPRETERFLAEILATCPKPSLHVCAGSSSLGDLKADMFHPGADVRADMYRLPFKDGAFGTVLADPPFPLDGVSLPQRLAQFQEMGRVVRKGGVVLLHAPWMPRSTWGRLEAAWVRDNEAQHGFPHAPVLLTKWVRVVDLDHVTRWPSKTRTQHAQEAAA